MNRDGKTPVFDLDNYEKMSKIRARLDERKRSSQQMAMPHAHMPTPPTFSHSPQDFNRDAVRSLSQSLKRSQADEQAKILASQGPPPQAPALNLQSIQQNDLRHSSRSRSPSPAPGQIFQSIANPKLLDSEAQPSARHEPILQRRVLEQQNSLITQLFQKLEDIDHRVKSQDQQLRIFDEMQMLKKTEVQNIQKLIDHSLEELRS